MRGLDRMMLVVAGAAAITACASASKKDEEPLGQLPTAVTTAEPSWIPFSIAAGTSKDVDPREKLLASLRQLTTEGRSFGATWHPDGKGIYFVKMPEGAACGRVHHLDLVTGEVEPVKAEGWTASPDATASKLFFVRGSGAAPCPGAPTEATRVVGAASVFVQAHGETPTELIPGAHAVAGSPDGRRLVLASTRDGDPELYAAGPDGKTITRLTSSPGYDGAPELSPDGSMLVWEAERLTASELAPPPSEKKEKEKEKKSTSKKDDAKKKKDEEGAKKAPAEKKEARAVTPRRLHVMLASSSGQQVRVIVDDGTFNTSPSFMPDSRRVLFSSNMHAPDDVDVYLVDPDGPVTATGHPRRIRLTFANGYDGQARISPNGKYILFTSSRGSTKPGGTDVFVARWLGE